MQLFSSIKSRLMALLFVATLLPITLLLNFHYGKTQSELLKLAGHDLLESTFLLARDLDRLLEQRQSEIRVISQADVFESDSIHNISQYINEIDLESRFVSGIEVFDLDLNLIAFSDFSGAPVDISHWPNPAVKLLQAAKDAKQGEVFFVEAFQVEERHHLKVIAPITDDSNTVVINLLVVSVNVAEIIGIIKSFDELILGDIPIQVIDNYGNVLFSSDSTLNGKRFTDLSISPALLDDFALPQQNVVREYVNHQNLDVVASFADMAEFGVNEGLDWSIYAASPKALVLELLNPVLKLSIYIFVSIIVSVLIAGFFVSVRIAKPIETLTLYADNKDVDVTLVKGARELRELRDHMVQSKESLESMNRNLEKAVEQRTKELKAAQNQVIEQAKMAALGRMVAGISHEINTPLGIIVTANTLQKENNTSLYKSFKNKTIKTSELEAFLETLKSSTTIIENASGRAVNLVQSFKQVAVNQTSDVYREVNLRDFLDEVVVMLRPSFRNLPYEIVAGADDFVTIIDGGALYQVISNLSLNALIHGFEGRDNGILNIELSVSDGKLMLHVKDDGNGLSDAQLEKIFEPFYTTKRGHGRTGLGTHIVYNLVTQKLGGKIRVNGGIGLGVEYHIEIPLNEEKS